MLFNRIKQLSLLLTVTLLLTLSQPSQAAGIIYVNQSATGLNDGTTWENAYTDLQDALTNAQAGDQIWVAQGTYKPTTGTDRTVSFNLVNGTAIYGGFAGTETSLEQRDWETNLTILSGDIGLPGSSNDNSYTVVSIDTINSVIFDGFVIQDGNDHRSFDNISSAGSGGGIYVSNSSPIINQVIIRNNSAEYGGGIINLDTVSESENENKLTLSQAMFQNNSAVNSGGGMLLGGSSASLKNLTFIGNVASYGGGLYLVSASSDNSIKLSHSTFEGNLADYGGGIYQQSANSNETFSHLVFKENSATTGGGGAVIYLLTLSQVTFSGNTVPGTGYGGGIYVVNGIMMTINNSIMWGNSSEIHNASVKVIVNDSIVQGGWQVGTNITDEDPLFVEDITTPGTGNLHLQTNSPAIDAGNNVNIPTDGTDIDGDDNKAEQVSLDLDKNSRIVNGTVDMGAYEYSPTPTTIPINSVSIEGPSSGQTNQSYSFQAVISPQDASTPINYEWNPEPSSGQGTAQATYQWDSTGAQGISVTASNSVGSKTTNHAILISEDSGSDVALTGVSISGPSSGETDQSYTFQAILTPSNASEVSYSWSPEPQEGQGTAQATYQWAEPGDYQIALTASNSGGSFASNHTITIRDTTPPPCPFPLTDVVIFGPLSSTVGLSTTLQAVIDPITATTPISYSWSPPPTQTSLNGLKATYIWPDAGRYEISLSAQQQDSSCTANTAMYTRTITVETPPPPGEDDQFEGSQGDNACQQATPINTDGTSQFRTFHSADDEDWVTFIPQAGQEYLISAEVPANSPAEVELALYDTCGNTPQQAQQNTFNPSVRLTFEATQSITHYLRLSNTNPRAVSAPYQLSVRALKPASATGALILVAGKLKEDDPVQPNINYVTDAVYDLALTNGCPAESIHYLSSDTANSRVSATASMTNLQQAITEWAVGRVNTETNLTLFMMDHGNQDKFYLNGRGDTVSSTELTGWLDSLQTETNTEVNVILDACYSGSFIEPTNGYLSQPNRLVMASTSVDNVAYASPSGAMFSDSLVRSLKQGKNLSSAFQFGRYAVNQAHADQQPWLDVNGNGIPNEDEDYQLAAPHTFACAGAVPQAVWVPYIDQAQVTTLDDGSLGIWATVLDDDTVNAVSAVVYPPDYEPPTDSETLIPATTTPPSLSMGIGLLPNVYSARYPITDPDTDPSQYTVVVYAMDNEGLVGAPVRITPQGETIRTPIIYLPVVVK